MKSFTSVKIILDTLSVGAGQLFVVFLMFTFFVCTGGIFGMQILVYSFRNRCVLDVRPVNHTICASDARNGWTQTCDFKHPAGEFAVKGGSLALKGSGFAGAEYEGSWCKVYCYTKDECKMWASYGRSPRSCLDNCLENYDKDARDGQGNLKYPRDRWGRVHSCSAPYAYCLPYANPKYGLQHFDNIGGFVPSVLQIAVPDSAHAILHQALQSEPEAFAFTWTFIVLVTVMCTWLMLGLFVAVVTGTFERVRKTYRLVRRGAFKNDQVDDVDPDSDRVGVSKGHDLDVETDHTDPARKFRNTARDILYESKYPVLMNLVVVGHCVAMIVQLEVPGFAASAKVLQYVAYILFVLESFLSVAASTNFIKYWNYSPNKVEILLILCSIVSFFPNCEFVGFFCAMRLFRLMKYFDTLQGLLVCAASSAEAILNLVMFLGLLCVCFGITGRYIFGDLMTENTRSHFGSSGIAVLTIFQLLVGDSWSTVLYEGMRVSGESYSTIFAATFLIAWFTFSKLVVSNLFVAVIIENFQVSDTIERASKPGYISKFRGSIADSYKSIYAVQASRSHLDLDHDMGTGHFVEKNELKYSFDAAFAAESAAEMQFRNVRNNPHLKALLLESVSQDSQLEEITHISHRVEERVLFCIGSDSPVKKTMIEVSRHPFFDFIVYASIIAGSFILLTTPPHEDIPNNQAWVSYSLRMQLEWIFTGVFTFEFLCRVLSDGFLFTKHAYMHDPWNRIDLLVLVFAWIDLMQVLEGTKFAKVSDTYTYTHTHTNVQAHTHTHTNTNIITRTNTHTHTHTHMHTHTQTDTHTHTHTRTHTHTHTHIHT